MKTTILTTLISLTLISAVSASTLVSCTTGATVEGSLACEGFFKGNDFNQVDSNTELFGLTGWEEIIKIDLDESGFSDIVVSSDKEVLEFTSYQGNQQGHYEFSNALEGYEYLFNLKNGNKFASFLINPLAETRLDWSLSGNALSHISVYRAGEEVVKTTEVDEPSLLWGLLALPIFLRKLDKSEKEVL